MELVALQGVLDDKSILQLSSVASHTVTRPVRHNAMKRQMRVARVWRKACQREAACQNELHDRMQLQKLASLIIFPERFAKARAMAMMTNILGRPVTHADIDQFSIAERAEARARQLEEPYYAAAPEGEGA